MLQHEKFELVSQSSIQRIARINTISLFEGRFNSVFFVVRRIVHHYLILTSTCVQEYNPSLQYTHILVNSLLFAPIFDFSWRKVAKFFDRDENSKNGATPTRVDATCYALRFEQREQAGANRPKVTSCGISDVFFGRTYAREYPPSPCGV